MLARQRQEHILERVAATGGVRVADVVEELGTQADGYLWRGLAHGAGFAVGLTALTWLLGARRLRVIHLPEPR